jgi:hypothetical protein
VEGDGQGRLSALASDLSERDRPAKDRALVMSGRGKILGKIRAKLLV